MMLGSMAARIRKLMGASRRACAGETLAETLVAVLVATFAALTLMASVAAAANINARAEANDRALAADQLAVETRDPALVGPVPGVALIVADDGSRLGAYDVDIFIGDEDKYRSYGKAGS